MAQVSTSEATPAVAYDAPADRPAVFRCASAAKGLQLLEVEGELDDAAITRWTRVLGGALANGTLGIAVDLRGCHAVGPVSLSALLAASSTLRARRGGGVRLVTYPDSALDRMLHAVVAEELPAYSSARRALASLLETR
jgi:anti-anti-sigma regulatory factor